MAIQLYLLLAALALLMTLGRIVVVRRRGAKAVDWELVVAFIRLDFLADQRDIAQKIAAGLAEIVGNKITRLNPEHKIGQIAGWAQDPVKASDLIKVLVIAFGISCDENTSFRDLVVKVAESRTQEAAPPPQP
jgi:hypothetical protein